MFDLRRSNMGSHLDAMLKEAAERSNMLFQHDVGRNVSSFSRDFIPHICSKSKLYKTFFAQKSSDVYFPVNKIILLFYTECKRGIVPDNYDKF